MKLVTLSDTHGFHRLLPPLPDGDVLIHAGDFSRYGDIEELEDFIDWFRLQPHQHKILIAGNHDLCLDASWLGDHDLEQEAQEDLAARARALIPPDIHYLQDRAITIGKIKFYGSPWVPQIGDWAFMDERGAKIQEHWNKIPNDTNVLITHGPSYGHGDLAPGARNAGCLQLLQRIMTVKPKLHIFGHIHEGYGKTYSDELPGTVFVNTAICNGRYQPLNQPHVLEII